MNILRQTDHQAIFIEHDTQLYDGAAEMVEEVSRSIGEAAKKAAILLYSPEANSFFEDLVADANRVSYLEQGPRSHMRMVPGSFLGRRPITDTFITYRKTPI